MLHYLVRESSTKRVTLLSNINPSYPPILFVRSTMTSSRSSVIQSRSSITSGWRIAHRLLTRMYALSIHPDPICYLLLYFYSLNCLVLQWRRTIASTIRRPRLGRRKFMYFLLFYCSYSLLMLALRLDLESLDQVQKVVRGQLVGLAVSAMKVRSNPIVAQPTSSTVSLNYNKV